MFNSRNRVFFSSNLYFLYARHCQLLQLHSTGINSLLTLFTSLMPVLIIEIPQVHVEMF